MKFEKYNNNNNTISNTNENTISNTNANANNISKVVNDLNNNNNNNNRDCKVNIIVIPGGNLDFLNGLNGNKNNQVKYLIIFSKTITIVAITITIIAIPAQITIKIIKVKIQKLRNTMISMFQMC